MNSALTDYLNDHNLVEGHALSRAIRVADESREGLGDVLSKLGILSEQEVITAYSLISGCEVISGDDLPDVPIKLDNIEDAFLKSQRVYPVLETDETIKLAAANPLDDFAKSAVEYVTGKAVDYLAIPPSEILHRYDNETEGADWSDQSATDFEGDDLERLKDLASEAPVIRYVNRLLNDAVKSGSSDIHIEPMDARLNVRMRLDGMLEDIHDPPHHLKAAIISRIKILAGLDIAERRLPQDGRIRMAIEGRDIDFRVSTTPATHGESVVLRVLNQHKMVLDPVALGFPATAHDLFNDALEKPNGIILVTGPTGSGKTTTLYTALNILNRPDRKILTIEDPVEYMLDGINQVQVNANIGLDFASALRSFLRQDPDIMMVGEIRDFETASIAVQASLTGHLILSTLHTNSAIGAIDRLIDMGVEEFLLASTLNMIMAQRLVRKLCDQCKQKNRSIYEAVGCSSCQNTGYKGRTVVIEMLDVTPDIQQLIKNRSSAHEIEKFALSQGFRTMEEQAKELVSQGITSDAEIFRVLGDRGQL